ncbi:MAG: hypothetical protein J3Q66DRAFT_342366 [Benniella sp.]|nr:MAG: hypothetical protein J3Q66DRAFT_342366 [Benniella sp.]
MGLLQIDLHIRRIPWGAWLSLIASWALSVSQMGRDWTADSTVRYGVDHHTSRHSSPVQSTLPVVPFSILHDTHTTTSRPVLRGWLVVILIVIQVDVNVPPRNRVISDDLSSLQLCDEANFKDKSATKKNGSRCTIKDGSNPIKVHHRQSLL